MEIMERRQLLINMFPDEELRFIGTDEDFDSAIIGVTEDLIVIYDYDKMLDWLVDNVDDIEDISDAADYLDYSILCYKELLNGVIILHSIEDYFKTKD